MLQQLTACSIVWQLSDHSIQIRQFYLKLPGGDIPKISDLRRQMGKGLPDKHHAQMITGNAMAKRAARSGRFLGFDV
jgi:hypothetical protein